MALGPPLPPTMLLAVEQTVFRVALVAVAAQESFQVISWIYPRADSLPVPFVGLQKLDCVPTSSKSVPPTATLNGVEANPLTARPRVATVALVKSSHPAEPASPADTNTVMPSAAACSQSLLKKLLPAVPNPASQAPKLRLITGARLLSMI